jgi:uncharacterized protein
MSEMKRINFRQFKKKVQERKRSLRRFLTRMETVPLNRSKKITQELEPEVWREVDCLGCANCCKTMTPTFTAADISRIARHLNMSGDEVKNKWLNKEKRTGDWVNKKTPCQFLDLTTNKCNIYAVRPADCAGFPHLRKNFKDYGHVHKQNVECCPATFLMVEKMQAAASFKLITSSSQLTAHSS